MLAALAAILASLPLAAGALIAARPFPRAAVRYRIIAAAFALAAAVGPLALAAASLRTAPGGLAASAAAAGFLSLFAGPVLTGVAGVCTVLLLELVMDVVKLRRVKREAAPLGAVAVRQARIGTSRTVSTPTAIGYLHPAVVLPEGFRARVDEREWDAVVAHECAHLARRDDWAKALQSAALRLGWWLPGLWILGRALDLERELASDEHAACETGPRRYAACLLRLATDRCSDGIAPAFGGRRSHVAIRVERLLRPVTDGGPALRAAALGAFTAAAFAIVAVALLAVPGTRTAVPHVATAVPRHAQAVLAHSAPSRAAQRVAERLHHAAARRPAGTVAFVTSRLGAAAPARMVAPAVAAPPAPAPAQPHAALVVARAPTPSVRAGRTEPGRTEARRAPAFRPDPTPPETLAFVAPQRRCRTCFGPLRSPDDGVAADQPTFTPPAGLPSGAAAAVAAGDPSSGPVDLTAQTVWFRIPARAVLAP